MGLDQIQQMITEAIVDSARDSAFIDLTLVDGCKSVGEITDKITDAKLYYKISIQIPFLREMILGIDGGLAFDFHKNILGNLSDESELDDTIKEFLNILAGNIMQKLYPTRIFALGIPERVKTLKISNNQVFHLYKAPDEREIVLLHQLHCHI